MKTSTRTMLALVGAAGLAACATLQAADKVSITLPRDASQFKPGAGAQIVQTQCVICHSADYVYMQPPLTRAQWQAVVAKMRKVYGAPLPEQQVKQVVDYLVTQNGRS